MKAFINSQFGYCPLVWMKHSRKLNNRINRIHERALRVAYDDNLSSFRDLLIKDKSVTMHVKNFKCLPQKCLKPNWRFLQLSLMTFFRLESVTTI